MHEVSQKREIWPGHEETTSREERAQFKRFKRVDKHVMWQAQWSNRAGVGFHKRVVGYEGMNFCCKNVSSS